MKNNVYIRSNRSIFTISITRIALLIPLIIYGFYKNGIHLYNNNYINLAGMFKPLVIIFGSALVGALINIIYEKLIKKSNDNFKDILFSSFHIEYGMVIGCLMPINVNLIVYFSTLTVVLFISKFLNNRVNIMCVAIILIYIISSVIGNDFIYANNYELDKTFSLEFMDYVIGKGVGGLASTHILLLLLAFTGMHLTSNNKSSITMSSIITLIIINTIYAIVKDINFIELLFSNNLIFIMTFVLTDSVTSCYTVNGKIAFGIIAAILTFAISLLNPIIAPFIAILIVSLFNIFIDKTINKIIKNNLH